jgi:hypothetical protein
MGNHPSRKKDWQNTTPRPLGGSSAKEEGLEGAAVALADPPPTWKIVLEDLTAAAAELRIDVAVRGKRAEPRFQVYAGQRLIGLIPVSDSLEIGEAMNRGGTGLLGRVIEVSIAAGRVEVELHLEGR